MDADSRTVTVGPRTALVRSRIYLKDINWIGDDDYGMNLADQPVKIKVRSTRQPTPAHFRRDAESIFVELDEPDTGISPGQACVFYDPKGDSARTLGGGWIARTA